MKIIMVASCELFKRKMTESNECLQMFPSKANKSQAKHQKHVIKRPIRCAWTLK